MVKQNITQTNKCSREGKLQNKIKKALPVILLLLLITVIIGVTYAVYNINLQGLINIKTEVPSISLTYEEPPQELIQTNRILSDEDNKTSTDYFEFKVSSTSSIIYELYYNIYLTEKTTNTLSSDNLYVYLTEVENEIEQEILEPTKLIDLTKHTKYDNSYIITNNNFNFLTNNKETKEKTYRFRIWNKEINSGETLTINGGTYEYLINIETITPPTPEYCFTTSGSTITDYNCYEGNTKGYETITDVVIPETINGVTITAINSTKVTYNNEENSNIKSMGNTIRLIPESSVLHSMQKKGLTSVVIPNTITYIGDYAFQNNNLTSVTFGSSVTRIGMQAFQGNRLTSIIIPNSIIDIDSYAFQGNKLEYVLIKEGSNLTETTGIGGNAFSTYDYTKPLTIYNNSGKKFKWYYITQNRNDSEDETYNFVTGTVPSYTDSSNYTYASVTITTGTPN